MNEEIIGMPVHLEAESVRVKRATGLYISLKLADLEKFREGWPEAEKYVDVEVLIDGRHTEMTFEEFTHRLFMELPT